MANKELNLCELLKGHEREKFYSDIFGEVTLTGTYREKIAILWEITYIFLSPDGSIPGGERCILFPSKEQRDWKKWAEENKKVTYEGITASPDYFLESCGYLFSSVKQSQKLLAINKLMNVQKYLEKGWQPDWGRDNEYKYFLSLKSDGTPTIAATTEQSSTVYFSTSDNAWEAIDILGEETIKLALSTDW